MYTFPWYIYALISLNFLTSAVMGVAMLFLAFWFGKLLQAAVRALDRWQPAKPPTSYTAPRPQAAVPASDAARYQPKG